MTNKAQLNNVLKTVVDIYSIYMYILRILVGELRMCLEISYTPPRLPNQTNPPTSSLIGYLQIIFLQDLHEDQP